MKKPVVLIIEDDKDIREQMKWALSKEYVVHTAGDRIEGLRVIGNKSPDAVTLDLGLPPDEGGSTEGMACLKEIIALDPLAKVIVITGNTEKENALKGVSMGAYDYLAKPVEMDDLKVILKRSVHVGCLERENKELQDKLEGGPEFEEMLGASPAMLEVFSTIRKVAATDVSVLITGESGTGKELVARAIHRRSIRKKRPFVPINCGAIPENLLESELFGYEKGAFTGAHAQKLGRIELAENGTVFFDEIGELPLQLQVKLLRFLQDKVLERVGGSKGVEMDVRVLAATNRDLKEAIKEGTFREDLYYRLAVINVGMPPLRERKDDLMLCAMAFLRRIARENKRSFKGYSPDAIDTMSAYGWPGNVRELENTIKRAVIMAEGKMITAKDLALEVDGGVKAEVGGLNFKEAKERVEKDIVNRALLSHGGNLSKAAKGLGISRPSLYDLIKKYKIGV
ncbi:MAG: PEP-CTERM-box response regulator transcription factor [Proteobacteria bacterium]|nr:PEP-CTERM-box response regulator transcription factor [Pseudomonadota bacterium]